MDNIIKNLIITDTIAEQSDKINNSLALQEIHQTPKAYYYLIPWLILNSNIKNNIFDYTINSSIPLIMFLKVFELVINKNNLSTAIDEVLNNIQLNNYQHYHNIASYNNYKNNHTFDKEINDTFLLEISAVIALLISDYKKMLKTSSEFITSITNNDIKKLSFVSLSILMFYAKTFYLTIDDSYNQSKWIDLLLDQFLNYTIDKYINVNYTEKKKFTLMLISYKSHINNKSSDILLPLPHVRISSLENIFCDKLNKNHYFIPGSTSDQVLLISFDFFITADNWFGNLTNNCLTYCQNRHINLFGSLFYYLVNKNTIIYDKFLKFNLVDDEIVDLIDLFNSIINHTKRSNYEIIEI